MQLLYIVISADMGQANKLPVFSVSLIMDDTFSHGKGNLGCWLQASTNLHVKEISTREMVSEAPELPFS